MSLLNDTEAREWMDRANAAEDRVEKLEAALAAESAERIALADGWRKFMTDQGVNPTFAALIVQGVIDKAEREHRRAQMDREKV